MRIIQASRGHWGSQPSLTRSPTCRPRPGQSPSGVEVSWLGFSNRFRWSCPGSTCHRLASRTLPAPACRLHAWGCVLARWLALCLLAPLRCNVTLQGAAASCWEPKESIHIPKGASGYLLVKFRIRVQQRKASLWLILRLWLPGSILWAGDWASLCLGFHCKLQIRLIIVTG